MECVGLLIALLGNIAVLIQNIILQMAMTCGAFHARRRRCAGVLLISENRAQKSHMSIRKSKMKHKRKHWVRPGRTSLWWDNFVNNIVVADEWRENFPRRISWNSVTRSDLFYRSNLHIMRSSIDVEKQVAITLYYLSEIGVIPEGC